MRNRAWMLTACNEAGDMRHVDEKNCANGIGNLSQPRKINRARIGGCACGDHDWSHFFGLFLQRVVIDSLGLLVHAVMSDLIKFAGEICRMSVSEMTAVREVHRENFVTRLNGGEIDRHVRLRAAVRLHVQMLRTEQTLSAVDGQ